MNSRPLYTSSTGDPFAQPGKDLGSNGLHADAPTFIPGSSPPNHQSPSKGWDTYQDHGMQSTSAGMDREAFAAGERAAMARSLQMLLPSQQALGMLSGGLQRLEAQVREDSLQARQAALATAEAKAVAQGLVERLNNLERNRLPAMESQIQHAIEAPLSQEFRATLQGLQGALNNVQRQGSGPYSLTGFMLRQVGWLGATASMYTQAAISKADVAAIFLSRKILLDNRVVEVNEGCSNGNSTCGVSSSGNAVSNFAKAACGAALFLAMVEASWQFHSRVLRSVPARLQKAVLPAQLGLKVMRIATWAATLTLSAVYFRRACYLVADSSVSSIDRLMKALYHRLPFCGSPPGPKPSLASSPAKTETEDLADSPKEDIEIQDTLNHIQGPEFGRLTNGLPVQRQRSVFDTPPPSPPPNQS